MRTIKRRGEPRVRPLFPKLVGPASVPVIQGAGVPPELERMTGTEAGPTNNAHGTLMLLTNHEHGVTLQVKVVPNASANKIVGEQDGRLVIRLTASPVEGKANKALIKFVSKQLKIPASCIAILHGHTSREKTLFFNGYEERTFREKIEKLV